MPSLRQFISGLLLLVAVLMRLVPRSTNVGTAKSFLLVIAHPDDEVMFFAPAIQYITSLKDSSTLHVLCLSSGDAAGLGATRKQELVNSVVQLGGDAANVTVVESPELQDSMSVVWDATVVAKTLSEYIEKQDRQFDAILTFDNLGISGHTNHKQIHHGAVELHKQMPEIQLWTLKTVQVWRKYISTLDIFSFLYPTRPNEVRFVSDIAQFLNAVSAMRSAHQSQMVWFRYLYIATSRYMTLNSFTIL